MSAHNPRVSIAVILKAVIGDRANLDSAFARHLHTQAQAAFIKAACFGVLRHYPRLKFFLSQLLDKPLKTKELELECLLLCGLYELFDMHTPDHAVVSETVNAARELRKDWARGLVNAVLRKAQRQAAQLIQKASQDTEASTAHPAWLIEAVQHDWPEDWQDILMANNQTPPMTLRLDVHQTQREDYLQQLTEQGINAHANAIVPCALTLEQAHDVTELPGFADGLVSVQDSAAQLAALLLAPQPGERILDACAAPGGKTLHLLQQQPALDSLLALDNEPTRLMRVQENLTRANISATLQQGDASAPQAWWDGIPFDRILLDAPCSATGVIRRHPDIKLLRRPDDIPRLAGKQAQILDALWPLLKTGGMLLYATCSVLKIENDLQIQRFLARHPDAHSEPIAAPWGEVQPYGRQILPGNHDMDGFYYALLRKPA